MINAVHKAVFGESSARRTPQPIVDKVRATASYAGVLPLAIKAAPSQSQAAHDQRQDRLNAAVDKLSHERTEQRIAHDDAPAAGLCAAIDRLVAARLT